jgi:Cu2+-exporting ATPase
LSFDPLTRGECRVVEIATEEGLTADEALALAAAVERESEHTIAQGIVKTAEERRLSIPRAQSFQALPGRGVQATVSSKQLLLGGPALLRQTGVQIDSVLELTIDRASRRGQAAITMLDGSKPIAVFAVADAVRDGISHRHSAASRTAD